MVRHSEWQANKYRASRCLIFSDIQSGRSVCWRLTQPEDSYELTESLARSAFNGAGASATTILMASTITSRKREPTSTQVANRFSSTLLVRSRSEPGKSALANHYSSYLPKLCGWLASSHFQNLELVTCAFSSIFVICFLLLSSNASSFTRNILIPQLLLLHTIWVSSPGTHSSRSTQCAVPHAQQ